MERLNKPMKLNEVFKLDPRIQELIEINKRMEDEPGEKIWWEGNQAFVTKNCPVCGDEYTYNLWDNRADEPVCCEKEECKKESERIRAEKEYKEKLKKILPKHYWNIETDYQYILESYYKTNVYISGNIGVGKTVLMASFVKKYMKEGIECKWVVYPELIMQIQNAYSTGGRGNATPLDIAEESAVFEGVLAVDDIGVEKSTDFVKQMTYHIINKRDQNMLRTLFTSNLSLAEMAELVDKRIASRLIGMCEEVFLDMDGDRRIDKPNVPW